jgi:hypothetical protein
MGGLWEAEIAGRGSNEPGFARRTAGGGCPHMSNGRMAGRPRYGTSFWYVAY